MSIIDFHSHILPSVDHGCADTDVAISQLSIMKKGGTDIAVATSHFYPHIHKVENYKKSVSGAVEQLMSSGITHAPDITLGAEVLLCEKLHMMDGVEDLCIRGTKVLLLELPFVKLKDSHYDVAERLMADGYTVVLAHIDRYLAQYGDGIDELLDMGAVAQINASSLYSFSTRKRMSAYITKGEAVWAIGSDLHGADQKCYRQFVRSQRRLGKQFGEIMTRSEKLLSGAELIKIKTV